MKKRKTIVHPVVQLSIDSIKLAQRWEALAIEKRLEHQRLLGVLDATRSRAGANVRDDEFHLRNDERHRAWLDLRYCDELAAQLRSTVANVCGV